jgi:hypothetical protein
MCNKKCSETGCPFAFTEESEKIQNYGCLPEPFEIMTMRIVHGKTWACHSDPTKPCIGGLKAVREAGFDNRILDKVLVNESTVTKELVSYSQDDAEKINNRQ